MTVWDRTVENGQIFRLNAKIQIRLEQLVTLTVKALKLATNTDRLRFNTLK